jgi:hypothetical protein
LRQFQCTNYIRSDDKSRPHTPETSVKDWKYKTRTSDFIVYILSTQRLSLMHHTMQFRQVIRTTRCISFSTSIATGVRRKPALPSTRLGQAYSTSTSSRRDNRPYLDRKRSFPPSSVITRNLTTASFDAADADMTSQPEMSELSDRVFGELSALTTCEVSHALEDCVSS